ncbi:MAG: hypothetical protein KAI43_10100 [Candidatus Aureabacteria bacterium]|nr:hypothetical protein [Candidatus Auribacterota bacterium]
MAIYETIQEFKSKILIPAGLALILSGCDCAQKTTSIFKDLDGDNKPEHIYMVQAGYTREFHHKPIYDLKMKKGMGDGRLSEEKLIDRIIGEPKEIRFEDVTGDQIPDLSYIICVGWSDPWNNVRTYELRMRKGKGDGTFGKTTVMERYNGDRDNLQ